MKIITGNKTHDDKMQLLEVAHQVSTVATATPAQIITADKTFFQAAAVSQATNSLTDSAFLYRLQEMRIGIYG